MSRPWRKELSKTDWRISWRTCRSVEVAAWGDRLLKLTDPFGNRLLFNEPEPAAP